MHRECGFIRIKPDTNKVAFISAQNTGTSLIVLVSSFLSVLNQASLKGLEKDVVAFFIVLI